MTTYAPELPALAPTTVEAASGARGGHVRWLATFLATAALAAYCLLLVVPSVLGLQRYVLTGSSMEPTIHRGSLVFDRVVPVQELRVGDVITYVPPGRTSPLSHRITGVVPEQGSRVFTTRGDANPAADPWLFTLSRGTQGRVAFSVPAAGYPLWLLGRPATRLVLVGGPAMLIAVLTLRRLWRDAAALAGAAGPAAEPAAE